MAREGKVYGIKGNIVTATGKDGFMQNETAWIYCGDLRLKSEVIKIIGEKVMLQVFEDTSGLSPGDRIEFTGELLSVSVGPGLLGKVYDGLQNSLEGLSEKYGDFLVRGAYTEPLDFNQKWEFTPTVEEGSTVYAGFVLGEVQEANIKHKIMLPFHWRGSFKIKSIVPAGSYKVNDQIAEVEDDDGAVSTVSMTFNLPVKLPVKCFKDRLLPDNIMLTGMRAIDTFFPVAQGGTYCIPGPFGAGKTVIQQMTSRNAKVDVVIIVACGERAGEVVETMLEFPKLEDPLTGKSLMERTIIICNTSSMPVSAREASVYTGVSLAEYYRQMGLDVLLLADSTSRWAQAMREISGRLEEIPGEEAFPAYLESRIASFYERAGKVLLEDGSVGSITIGGTVSPAGGNFSEPVTQSSLKVVGAFHGLSRERAQARKFPSIDPLESWSKYGSIQDEKKLKKVRGILTDGDEIKQMMNVLGEDGISIENFTLFQKAEFIDNSFIQQNSFDDVDTFCSEERQVFVFEFICTEIVERDFSFKTSEESRSYFNNLQQLFIDWNYSVWDSDEFKANQKKIAEYLKN